MKSSGRYIVATLIVAALAAVFAVLFRASLSWVYRSLYGASSVVEAITGLPGGWRLIVPTAAALAAGLVTRARRTPAQNVSNVMEAIALGRVQLSLAATATRVAASWMAIAGGLSIGREGPLIETGGAFGARVAHRWSLSLSQTRVLVAAGTAAGFAAAYNTPFAAVLFVLETMAGVTAPALVMPVMAATTLATVITRATVGAGPIYGARTFAAASLVDMVLFTILGGVAALVAVAFKQLLRLAEHWFERLPWGQPWRALGGGLLVGAIAWRVPAVAGNGYEPLNQLLDAPLTLGALTVLILAKMLATSGSVASGIPGGVFTPMLLVGAGTGAAWAALVGHAGIAGPVAGSYALVGMAAATAASIHAPLTAAVMVFELSGDYGVVLPLVLATVVATLVSRVVGSESVYESELRKRGLGWDFTLEGRRLKSQPPARSTPREDDADRPGPRRRDG